jgi:hypothetical protein
LKEYAYWFRVGPNMYDLPSVAHTTGGSKLRSRRAKYMWLGLAVSTNSDGESDSAWYMMTYNSPALIELRSAIDLIKSSISLAAGRRSRAGAVLVSSLYDLTLVRIREQ